MSDENNPDQPAIPQQPKPSEQSPASSHASDEVSAATAAGSAPEASEEAAGAAPTAAVPGAADEAADPAAEELTPGEAPATKSTPGWVKPALGTLAVISIIAGGAGYFLGKSVGDASLPDAEAAYIGGPRGALNTPADIHRVNPEDPFALGSENAKVVISYFSDFRCPVCANYDTEIEPKIIEEYVNDGRVRLEWNDYPFLSENSLLPAQGGRAAAAQGKFWEFKDAVYRGFEGNEHPTYTVDDLVGFAEEAGVPNLDKFREDVESGKYASTVMQALIYGGYLGVNSTPTFVVNGVSVQGTDYESLKKAIEQSLEKGQPEAPALPEQGAAGADQSAHEEESAPAEG